MGLILQPVHSLSANSQRSSQRTEQLSVHAKTAAITEACCYQGLSRMEAEGGSDNGMAAAVFHSPWQEGAENVRCHALVPLVQEGLILTQLCPSDYKG